MLGLLAGGLLGVLAAALPEVARAEVAARLKALSQATGVEVRVDRVRVDLFGRIALTGVVAEGPAGSGVGARVERVATRLKVEELLAGRKRLDDIRIEGLDVRLSGLPEDPEALLRDIRRRADVLETALGRSGQKTRSSPDGLADLRILALGARIEATAPDGSVRTLVRDLKVDLGRDAHVRTFVLKAMGRIGDAGSGFELEASAAGRRVAASFDPPLPVPGVPASVRDVTFDPDEGLLLTGIGLEPERVGGVTVEASVERVRVRGAGGAVPVGLSDLRVAVEGVRVDVRLMTTLKEVVALVREKVRSGGTTGAGAPGGRRQSALGLLRRIEAPIVVTGIDVIVHEPGESFPAATVSGGSAQILAGQGVELKGGGRVQVGSLPAMDVVAEMSGLDEGLPPREASVGLSGLPLGRLLRERAKMGVFTGAGAANVHLTYVRDRGPSLLFGQLEGAVELVGLTIDDGRISQEPVVVDGVTVSLSAERDEGRDAITLRVGVRARNGAHADLQLEVVGRGKAPVYDVVLDVPKQSCPAVVEAIPRGMLPNIGSGLKVRGTLSGRIEVHDLDPEDIPHLRLVTEGDLSTCEIRSLGHEADARLRLLQTRFKIPVDEGEGPIGVNVGPAMKSYVSLEAMPELIRAGPLLTEDGEFYIHQGFSRKRLEGALRLDLAKGRYVYGGSTITQQLVKNLFLHRTKTLARKLEEAAIVLAVERTLTKQRIMELYLNCIEYGTKLYGIRNASSHYFHKSLADLTPLEVAFLMHLKTTPKEAFFLEKRGVLPPRWREALRIRMRNFQRKGYITKEELEAAAPYDPIVLRGAGSE